MTHTQLQSAPHFYIVGAAKAGTTAVWTWLQSHPDVFLPDVKEPGFFAFEGENATPHNGPYDPNYVSEVTTDAQTYQDIYSGAGGRICGDVSPVYLIAEHAAARIAAARPDARIVILLRDPVKRAFSQYLHHVRDCLEPSMTFEAALDAENERLAQGWSWGHGYATHGHYARQIERYLDVFPREQILFLTHEDIQSNPEKCWHLLCEHLQLAACPMPNNERVNETANLSSVSSRAGISRALRHPGAIQTAVKRMIPKFVRSRLRKTLEGAGRPVPQLRTGTRARLSELYMPERSTLEKLTGLSLGHWT